MSSTTTTSTSTTTTSAFPTGVQYGFYFDQGRCVDCKTCSVACKSWNNIDPGPAKWCRVMSWETGSWPNVTLNALFAPCYHCANPVCVAAANGAMYKEPNYGAVLIDPAQATSPNLRLAWQVCPYGAIVFDGDGLNATASKCTMCVDRLTQGMAPICVLTCYMRALDFGPIDQLVKKYGNNRDLSGALPSSTTTTPSIIFKPRISHTNVVSYDASRAITLMGKRDPYPAVFTDSTLLTPQPGVVGRGSLNLKPQTAADLMKATQNDEG